MVFKNFPETGLNHTTNTEDSTGPPTVMSQGLGQLHAVFPRFPVLAPLSS